jgi:hypothetical protein
MTRNLILALALIAAPVLVGCGSNTTESIDSGTGTTPFGLSVGDNCYTINAIASGYSDGCGLFVLSTQVGASLPMNYDATTATATLGTQGSLGGGTILNNQGTLVRDGDTSDGTGCTWHQNDNTLLQMTANNQFTVSVTEVESVFSTACGASASTCTSTWTWTMQKSAVTTLVPPACGAAP